METETETETAAVEHEKMKIEISRKQQYLGDISALCFVHLPSSFSSFPYLLAGSGSQLLLYDLQSGTLITSFHVFQGIRIHGITITTIPQTPSHYSSTSTTFLAFKLAVYGEKRLKLFHLNIQQQQQQQQQQQLPRVDFNFIHSLPNFGHWVLDVLFLEVHDYLAIGLSDNSVCVWDIATSTVVLQLHSPDKCLLYSMRLWGLNLQALRIASGTIFNEIIIWKVVPRKQSLDPVENSQDIGIILSDDPAHLQYHQYQAVHVQRLVGHEGSIFRLAWSTDGFKLLSVSDDRSARIWMINDERKESDNLEEVVGPVLFGHNARVWDCCISDSLIITAGEDCTCRVWGLDGVQLKVIREHLGRGMWRCLYDPNSSLVVTAGFDSAIKVHQLPFSSVRSTVGQTKAKEFDDRTEILTFSLPRSSEHIGLMDSKSEYVRCLHFTCEDTLYIATNHGYLYRVTLSDAGDAKWTKLAHVSEKVPIISMDFLAKHQSENFHEVDDWVALGDGKGNMTIVRVTGNVSAPEVAFTTSWPAELERQLLGTHWCKPLGERFVFTADPRGALKLWRLDDPARTLSDDIVKEINATLIAEFKSSFGMRILCLDASLQEEVLVCGDLRGNIVLFPLLKSMLLYPSAASEVKISPLSYFKGGHGISCVSSISVARLRANEIEICSTGGDGCICHFKYDRYLKILEFIGMKQMKELSLIQSVSADSSSSSDDLAECNYAAGFASADFIIWNLITETKVAEIPCGGWRRPHSYYFGAIPEKKICFAYVKDETIYVHRHLEPEKERNIFPMNLHMQFHGREMHSICFVNENVKVGANREHIINDKSSWIASGCEDGTVRLTGYDSEVENWSASKLLGEHVSGSAVRSICCVSNMYTIASDKVKNGQYTAQVDQESPFLLISVGAKRVLTSWLLRSRSINLKEETLGKEHGESANGYVTSLKRSSSMSFQWFSTDMPNKSSSTHGRTGKNGLKDNDDDWRYLAVTAFQVKCTGSRSSVCFVVIACSDATLALRALILPHRLWFDVASLVSVSSPVLALQHIIIPTYPPSDDNIHGHNAYIVISGATDGSLAFWDLTESVEAFVRQVSNLDVEKFMGCQKRPQTGRGSQGGRWWRSIGRSISQRTQCGDSNTEKAEEKISSSPVCGISDLSLVDSPPEIYEVEPLHMVNNLHQSGVNCLHVSQINNLQGLEQSFHFCVVSGGDDQALHCLQFDLSPIQKYKIRFSRHKSIASAHSSAIKGIWTDGRWVFSTGLDQRVRCWLYEVNGDLKEHAHIVVSVPEPEALDAKACSSRDHYQIVVAGRGMQMIEFSASSKSNGG